MAQCSVDGCDGTAKTRGWCHAHYMRWFMKGDPGTADIVRRPKGRVCSVAGCDRKHQGRGFCEAHLRRFLTHGDPGPAEIEPRRPGLPCSVNGCENAAEGRGLCDKHLQRERKTGSATTPLPEHGPTWTGNEATYGAVHLRLRERRGRASTHQCAKCGVQAEQWAYDHSDPSPKFNERDQPYSTDLTRYLPLCKVCHRRMDAERTRTQGCSILGCEAPHKARGFCNKHYRRALAGKL